MPSWALRSVAYGSAISTASPSHLTMRMPHRRLKATPSTQCSRNHRRRRSCSSSVRPSAASGSGRLLPDASSAAMICTSRIVSLFYLMVPDGSCALKLPPFEYASPGTVDDAVALLAERDGEASVLAGGQSLVPLMARRLARPELLVDINRVAGLDRIERVDGHVVIGACVRHAELER